MSILLALVATILTSFLPILNKRILRDARPAQVAWVVNAASLPLLAVGTLLVTQCSITLAVLATCAVSRTMRSPMQSARIRERF